jgi:hypothetical protein
MLLVLHGHICNVSGRHPFPCDDLAELVRMAFETGVIATTLIDGEIVLWTGKKERFD